MESKKKTKYFHITDIVPRRPKKPNKLTCVFMKTTQNKEN